MNVGEARKVYSAQLRAYNAQSVQLAKQRSELQEKMSKTENGAQIFADEAATLDLTYQAIKDKQSEYQTFMDRVTEQYNAKMEMVSGQQQAESAKEAYEDLAKIMEVARRIMHGDTVPAQDEKKLMEYDSDLYQMAKSAGMMARMQKKKKYDSLWDDEEKQEQADPAEEADAQELSVNAPEVISVEETMAAATESFENTAE